jgi:MarR family transcriptional regulator for hemolysin
MLQNEQRLRDGIASLIARVGRQWRREVDRRLQPFGLTEATWLPLVHLARTLAPMRQKDLAASLVLDGSTVVRLLDALEASGLIERREESTDRRAKVITITSGGRSIIDQVEIASREVRDTALLGLTEADLESATRALALIQTNLEAAQERAGDEPFTRAPRQRA